MNTIRENEKLLKALANRRRLMIVRYLNKKAPASVGSVAEDIKLSLMATSKHLRLLLDAEVVERDQVGPYAQYRLAAPLHPVVKLLLSSL